MPGPSDSVRYQVERYAFAIGNRATCAWEIDGSLMVTVGERVDTGTIHATITRRWPDLSVRVVREEKSHDAVP